MYIRYSNLSWDFIFLPNNGVSNSISLVSIFEALLKKGFIVCGLSSVSVSVTCKIPGKGPLPPTFLDPLLPPFWDPHWGPSWDRLSPTHPKKSIWGVEFLILIILKLKVDWFTSKQDKKVRYSLIDELPLPHRDPLSPTFLRPLPQPFGTPPPAFFGPLPPPFWDPHRDLSWDPHRDSFWDPHRNPYSFTRTKFLFLTQIIW